MLSREIGALGIRLVQAMKIDSLRAEITLFEAARAYAAADNRTTVEPDDLRAVAPMALRMRKSQSMADFLDDISKEESQSEEVLSQISAFKE